MKKILISIFAILLLPFPASPQSRRAFTIKDLYALKYMSQLSISPDGTRVLFTLTDSDLEKGSHASHIWMLNREDGSVHQLTRGDSLESSPSWSGNGDRFYFLSNRRKSNQVWQLDTQGGDPAQLTAISTGINQYHVSPLDSSVFYSSSIFPECGANDDCNKTSQEQLETGPTQAHHATGLLYRHWTAYRNFQYDHLFHLNRQSGKTDALTEGENDYPTYGGAFVLSPDGTEICVTINPDSDKAESTNSDLLLINLKTGKHTNITGANEAFDGDPAYSPDGRYIAFRLQKIPGYESDRFRLAIYDRTNGRTTFLTEHIQNWIQSFEWSPDSQTIYFTVPEAGYTTLYQVRLSTGQIKPVIEGHAIREFRISPDGTIIFIRSAVGDPYEIWEFRPAIDRRPRQLTQFNSATKEAVDIRPAESIWVDGADGKKIQVFIVKPHNFDPDRKYPLILNVHGGPQMMWSDSFRGDWQVYPGAGYVVAFPNPHGSTGYGQDFTAAISRDYDGKVMEDINRVTETLAALPYVDPDRMGAMGWSWGGYAMMWLEGHNEHFKALASMMGIFDLTSMYYGTEELWFPNWDNGGAPWENPEYYHRASPSTYVKAFRTPCLVITGERDYRVPYTQSLQFFTALQKMNVPSELIVFSNDGHWPDSVKSMPVYYNAHLEWFHTYLGGDPAPYKTEDLIRNRVFTGWQEESR